MINSDEHIQSPNSNKVSKEATKKPPTITQRQIEIMNNAADSLLVGEGMKAIARDGVEQADKGQLHLLMDALDEYPGVVTEAVWKTFKATVAERLKDSPSKDTLTNRLKRATMGLTLAKENQSFAPTALDTNLKKYAESVGKKLQAAIDPETGQPRLKCIAKPEKATKLPKGTFYWLVACEGPGFDYKAMAAGNTIICGPTADFEEIRECAQAQSGAWQTMLCLTAPEPVLLDLAREKKLVEPKPAGRGDYASIAKTYGPSVEGVEA